MDKGHCCGGGRRGRSKSASGVRSARLQAARERGLPGASLALLRLKSLPTHLSLPYFLNLPAPQIPLCQNLSNLLASSSTFYILSRSCISPLPPRLPNLSATNWQTRSLPVLPCTSLASRSRNLNKEMGVYSPLDPMHGPISKYKQQIIY